MALKDAVKDMSESDGDESVEVPVNKSASAGKGKKGGVKEEHDVEVHKSGADASLNDAAKDMSESDSDESMGVPANKPVSAGKAKKGEAMEDHDLEVHKSGADASLTIPMQAGNLKKNGLVMIKGHPCKVVETATSKTGKHGHAKITYVGIDLFTGKKYDDMAPTSHNVEVPVVDRQEYLLADVSKEDKHVDLMDQKTYELTSVRMVEGTEENDSLNKLLIDMFEDGKEVLVSVLRAMGQEAIVSVREQNKKD